MFEKYADVISGTVILSISLIMYTASAPSAENASGVDLNIAPRLIAICMGLLSLFLIISCSYKNIQKKNTSAKTQKHILYPQKLIFCILLTLFAGIAFEPIGFIITSIVYLFTLGYVLSYEKGEFKPVRMVIFAVTAPIIISYIFSNWLSMPLPSGLL